MVPIARAFDQAGPRGPSWILLITHVTWAIFYQARHAFGLRFVIFVKDHDPPHVLVFGQGAEAKIDLPSDGPRPWTGCEASPARFHAGWRRKRVYLVRPYSVSGGSLMADDAGEALSAA